METGTSFPNNEIQDLFEKLQSQSQHWFSSEPQTVEELNKYFTTRVWRTASELMGYKHLLSHSHYSSFVDGVTKTQLKILKSSIGHVNQDHFINTSRHALDKLLEHCDLFSKETKDERISLTDSHELLTPRNFEIKSIKNFISTDGSEHRSTKLISVLANLKNKDRSNYLSVRYEFLLLLDIDNSISITVHDVLTTESCPVEYPINTLQQILDDVFVLSFNKWMENKVFTVIDLISEYLNIICDIGQINSILSKTYRNQIDINEHYGPRCSITGALTFGEYRVCPIRRCNMLKDEAILINGSYYHPDVVRICSSCSKQSPYWVNRNNSYICTECHDENN